MTRTRVRILALKRAVEVLDHAIKLGESLTPDVTPREQNSIDYEFGELRHDLAEQAGRLEATEKARDERKKLKIAA